jgi:hypothetical protein
MWEGRDAQSTGPSSGWHFGDLQPSRSVPTGTGFWALGWNIQPTFVTHRRTMGNLRQGPTRAIVTARSGRKRKWVVLGSGARGSAHSYLPYKGRVPPRAPLPTSLCASPWYSRFLDGEHFVNGDPAPATHRRHPFPLRAKLIIPMTFIGYMRSTSAD